MPTHPTARYNTMILADERRRIMRRPRIPRVAWEALGERLIDAVRSHRADGDIGSAIFAADRAVEVLDRAARPQASELARLLVARLLRDKAAAERERERAQVAAA